MVLRVLSLVLVVGLVFWVGFVCWYSVMVVREAVRLRRSDRTPRLAKWVFRCALVGVLSYPLSSAPSALAASEGASVRQMGERIWLGGIMVVAATLVVSVVVAMRAADGHGPVIDPEDTQGGA
jgi:hypothetical protein